MLETVLTEYCCKLPSSKQLNLINNLKLGIIRLNWLFQFKIKIITAFNPTYIHIIMILYTVRCCILQLLQNDRFRKGQIIDSVQCNVV